MTEQKKGCLVCRKKEYYSFIKGFRHIYEDTGRLCDHFIRKLEPKKKKVVQFT